MAKPIPKPSDPIRDRRHIRIIKDRLVASKKYRELLYFVVSINSGLRVNDVLGLQVDDFWEYGQPRKRFSLHTQKTGSLIITQINDAIHEAMALYQPLAPLYDSDALLFSITRRTATRWVKQWCIDAGIDQGNYSAHSLRKTFAYHLWASKGKDFEALVIVSKALGHLSTGVTLDYLGIRREQIAQAQLSLNL
jgi:integrase